MLIWRLYGHRYRNITITLRVIDRARYGQAISGHNQYGLWGPGAMNGQVAVAIGFTEPQLRQFYDEVTPGASVSPQYAMPEESGLTIFVCRRPKKSLQETWAKWKYLN